MAVVSAPRAAAPELALGRLRAPRSIPGGDRKAPRSSPSSHGRAEHGIDIALDVLRAALRLDLGADRHAAGRHGVATTTRFSGVSASGSPVRDSAEIVRTSRSPFATVNAVS